MNLYHYCCQHSARAITKRGFLEPFDHAGLFGVPLVWLTDSETPDREALGLTSHIQPCDRLEFRYVVTDVDRCEPWIGSDVRNRLATVGGFDAFEAGRDPSSWWISRDRLWAVRDSSWSMVVMHGKGKP